MKSLIKIIGNDLYTKLGKFVSIKFNKIKWDRNDVVIVGTTSKPAEILVRMHDGVDIEYAEQCASHFNRLSQESIHKLYEYSLKHCLSYCEYFEEDPPQIKKLNEISYYIEPSCMYVDNPKNSDTAYIVDLHCAWEPEHGLSWIIRNNEVLYVGEGMVSYHLGAWEDLDSYKKDAGNFVFGNLNWG